MLFSPYDHQRFIQLRAPPGPDLDMFEVYHGPLEDVELTFMQRSPEGRSFITGFPAVTKGWMSPNVGDKPLDSRGRSLGREFRGELNCFIGGAKGQSGFDAGVGRAEETAVE